MKFEILSDNKIKIILNIKELEEKNIDFHSFMANSLESQHIFLEILKQAEKETGFITHNYNVHIETFATSDGTFIFTVTKISKIDSAKKKKVVYKRKIIKSSNKLIVYLFNSFDDYCDFCAFIGKHFSNFCLKNATLLSYNSNYYLILHDIKQIDSKRFLSCISEFANMCDNSELFINKLLEYGDKLIPEDAIEIGIRYLG